MRGFVALHRFSVGGRFMLPLILLSSSCQDQTPGGPMPPAERWTAELEWRVGSRDDPDLSFTRFQGLVVGEEGKVFTRHPRESVVRAFAGDGSFLRVLGRRGEGPGEFQRVHGLGLVGDTLWVGDLVLSEFSLFSQDGEFLYSFSVPSLPDPQSGVPTVRASRILCDGTIAGETVSTVGPDGFSDESVVLMNRDGRITDTIATTSLAGAIWASPPGPPLIQPFHRSPSPLFFPAEPALLWVYRDAPSSADRAKITLVKETLTGDTVFVREYWYEPTPITQAEIDSVLDANVTSERSRAWLQERLYRPGFHPFPEAVVLGNDGWIWASGNASGERTVPWFAFDPEGVPTGRVDLPGAFTVYAADSAHFWGAEYDEYDVPYLVRYRIDRE